MTAALCLAAWVLLSIPAALILGAFIRAGKGPDCDCDTWCGASLAAGVQDCAEAGR